MLLTKQYYIYTCLNTTYANDYIWIGLLKDKWSRYGRENFRFRFSATVPRGSLWRKRTYSRPRIMPNDIAVWLFSERNIFVWNRSITNSDIQKLEDECFKAFGSDLIFCLHEYIMASPRF